MDETYDENSDMVLTMDDPNIELDFFKMLFLSIVLGQPKFSID